MELLFSNLEIEDPILSIAKKSAFLFPAALEDRTEVIHLAQKPSAR